MSRRNIGKLLARNKPAEEAPKPKYICTIPDDVVITREVFKQYLRKYPRAKQFGFSKTHTAQITQLRSANGSPEYPHNLYNLPVAWNQDVSYIM
jgi:hypothetical protein